MEFQERSGNPGNSVDLLEFAGKLGRVRDIHSHWCLAHNQHTSAGNKNTSINAVHVVVSFQFMNFVPFKLGNVSSLAIIFPDSLLCFGITRF